MLQAVDNLQRQSRPVSQARQYLVLREIVFHPCAIGLRHHNEARKTLLILRKQPDARAENLPRPSCFKLSLPSPPLPCRYITNGCFPVASGRNSRYGITKSLLCVRASYFFSSPSDSFLNASIKAIRSGDIGDPGASEGVALSLSAAPAAPDAIENAKLFDAANHAPADADPNRRAASRRVIICIAISFPARLEIQCRPSIRLRHLQIREIRIGRNVSPQANLPPCLTQLQIIHNQAWLRCSVHV